MGYLRFHFAIMVGSSIRCVYCCASAMSREPQRTCNSQCTLSPKNSRRTLNYMQNWRKLSFGAFEFHLQCFTFHHTLHHAFHRSPPYVLQHIPPHFASRFLHIVRTTTHRRCAAAHDARATTDRPSSTSPARRSIAALHIVFAIP